MAGPHRFEEELFYWVMLGVVDNKVGVFIIAPFRTLEGTKTMDTSYLFPTLIIVLYFFWAFF